MTMYAQQREVDYVLAMVAARAGATGPGGGPGAFHEEAEGRDQGQRHLPCGWQGGCYSKDFDLRLRLPCLQYHSFFNHPCGPHAIPSISKYARPIDLQRVHCWRVWKECRPGLECMHADASMICKRLSVFPSLMPCRALLVHCCEPCTQTSDLAPSQNLGHAR